MKRRIRKSVFETNSSSEHSLQVVQTKNASDIIYREITKKFEENCDSYGYDGNYKDELLDYENNTLELKGFNEEYCDEQTFSTHIITDPIFKIQYLFGLLYGFIRNKYFFKKTDNAYGWELLDEVKNGLENYVIERTEEYVWFKDAVLDYLKNNETYNTINIVKLYAENKIETYSGDSEGDIDTDVFKTKDDFLKTFNSVMNEENSIMSMDIPYSMYGSPNIKIY